MPRFQKTRMHAATAVLLLLGLYALAGLGYAAWSHSGEAATVWTIVAVAAFIAAIGFQRFVAIRGKREG